jgi:SAM-dependent methyltransferase
MGGDVAGATTLTPMQGTGSSSRTGSLALPRHDARFDGSGDPLDAYERSGVAIRREIERLLPREWSLPDRRMLDFRGEGDPPLPHPDQHFDLVCAISAFTRLSDRWAEWLLELHRLLSPDGFLIATFMGRRVSEELAGEIWEEDRVGMNVLRGRNPPELGEPIVLHSEWWIRAHWGRLFEIVELDERPQLEVESTMTADPSADPSSHTWALLRKRAVRLTSEDLQLPEPEEPREVAALRHNVRQLQRRLEAVVAEMEAMRRSELDALRESFHGELARKAVRIAQAEKATEEVAHNFESTLSWRVTKPLRAVRRIAQSVRRN